MSRFRSAETSHHPHHRDVAGGPWRAAVFGISDGLVSNTSLVLGVAGADPDASVVRLAGLAGLLAGAFSMAAGEYISVRSQNDLLQYELQKEEREIARSPDAERRELAVMYEKRGVDPETAASVARQIMADPEVALEVHAQEELGVTPGALGSPVVAAASSFGAFVVGALLPLIPWFFFEGDAAVAWSMSIAVVAASLVGWGLGVATGGHRLWFAARQLFIAAAASGVTYAVGSAVGIAV
jgi:VIT1/CCC1 family predicted Fe2+/Mn2+ transporter